MVKIYNWFIKQIKSISEQNASFFFTILVFLLSFVFIADTYDLSLLLTNTTVTGGDTGSQIYRLFYLQKVFPLLRWWSPDWYSGFPLLYFYPPLMFWISTILSYLIPTNIAFKLVTFAPVLMYPIAAYLCLKLLDLKYPIPQMGAVLSLSLMFFEKFTIYGGNLASLLSGQFSHTASIALMLIFIGLIYKYIKETKYFTWAILTGTAVMLTHPVSAILLIIISPLFIFQDKKIKQAIIKVFKVYFGIFLLSALWTFGFLFYKGYSGYMSWGKEIKLEEIFPTHLMYITFAAYLSIPIALIKREKRLIGVIALLILTVLGYCYVDKSNIWNNRFLPYVLFCFILLAAYVYGTIIQVLRKKLFLIADLLIVLFIIYSFIVVKNNISFTPYWFQWNYEGYEVKKSWSDVDGLFKYLDNLPKGRVMWEFQQDFGKYGTTRVLETVPFFTKQPTFEGLSVDSALYAPFHFIVQTETTNSPTSAIAGFTYPPFDFPKGVKHMQLTGTKYFVAYTDYIKNFANTNNDLIKIKDTGSFSVYKVEGGSMINIISDISIEKKDKNWLNKSIEWFKKDDFSSPIVFTFNDKETNYLSKLKQEASSATKSSISNIKEGRDYIEFDTNNIGVAHIINITYFPTWRVSGAKGPFLVSPCYMMVIPTEKHVKLYFTYGMWDWVGFALTGLGVIYIIYFRKPRKL